MFSNKNEEVVEKIRIAEKEMENKTKAAKNICEDLCKGYFDEMEEQFKDTLKELSERDFEDLIEYAKNDARIDGKTFLMLHFCWMESHYTEREMSTALFPLLLMLEELL